jgi:hypothetical protein
VYRCSQCLMEADSLMDLACGCAATILYDCQARLEPVRGMVRHLGKIEGEGERHAAAVDER